MREAERESAHAGRRGPGRAAGAARAFDRSAAQAARALDGPPGMFNHFAQRGGRFSKNAAMPSCPSSPARRRAISSQVSAGTAAGSPAVTSRTSFFASAIAVGPPFARSATMPESAASSSAGGATRSPRPQRGASAAPKVSPVQKRRRARAGPTRAITKGAIIAGAIPSRTSEKAKCASLEAPTPSAAARSPTPPPGAGPLPRATTGRGSSATAANTACVRRASSRFAAGPASRMRRIQFRSAPAEKTLPAPVTTTTRTAGSAAQAASASPRRATSASSSAFPTSGRSRVRVATPSCRSTRSISQPLPSALPLVGRARQDRRGHVELEGEERLRKRLPLMVGAQRERPPAPERVAEDEVDAAHPGELVALDRPATQVAEVERPAPDTEPGGRLERQAEHGVRETLHLAALGVAHGGAEDAFVRLDLRRRGAPAAPVADQVGAPVGELRADAVPEHLREALRLRTHVGAGDERQADGAPAVAVDHGDLERVGRRRAAGPADRDPVPPRVDHLEAAEIRAHVRGQVARGIADLVEKLLGHGGARDPAARTWVLGHHEAAVGPHLRGRIADIERRHLPPVGQVAARRLRAALEHVPGDRPRGEPVPVVPPPAELEHERPEREGRVG